MPSLQSHITGTVAYIFKTVKQEDRFKVDSSLYNLKQTVSIFSYGYQEKMLRKTKKCITFRLYITTSS